MNNWDDLLLSGGFAPREHIVAGLTLEQVEARPDEVPHSIDQELWHAAMALNISLDEGRFALERWLFKPPKWLVATRSARGDEPVITRQLLTINGPDSFII